MHYQRTDYLSGESQEDHRPGPRHSYVFQQCCFCHNSSNSKFAIFRTIFRDTHTHMHKEMFIQFMAEQGHNVVKSERKPRRNIQYRDLGMHTLYIQEPVILSSST